MSQIILGVLALAAALWILKSYSRASPTLLAGGMRKAGGLAVMAVGGLLLVRGRFDLAIPLFVFGAGLAGWLPGMPGRFSRSTPSPGRRSRVRSRMLDMELDHDSGTLAGQVVTGRFAGRSLAELQEAELRALYVEVRQDPDGLSLLEAYLDRRTPGWREDFQDDAATRPGRGRSRNAMTKEEAYEVLGVQPGAEAEEIRRAHRTLMKKLHPDQGGSTYLAARVNEARDLLLGSHS
jgi:DnaJ-domain-containing protein 1